MKSEQDIIEELQEQKSRLRSEDITSVLNLLEEKNHLTISDICYFLKMNKDRVRRAVVYLKRQKVVEFAEGGGVQIIRLEEELRKKEVGSGGQLNNRQES